jgi:hypothetical protein
MIAESEASHDSGISCVIFKGTAKWNLLLLPHLYPQPRLCRQAGTFHHQNFGMMILHLFIDRTRSVWINLKIIH